MVLKLVPGPCVVHLGVWTPNGFEMVLVFMWGTRGVWTPNGFEMALGFSWGPLGVWTPNGLETGWG